MRRHTPESARYPSPSTGQLPAPPPDSSRQALIASPTPPTPAPPRCTVSLSAIFAFPASVSRHSLGSNSPALRSAACFRCASYGCRFPPTFSAPTARLFAVRKKAGTHPEKARLALGVATSLLFRVPERTGRKGKNDDGKQDLYQLSDRAGLQCWSSLQPYNLDYR